MQSRTPENFVNWYEYLGIEQAKIKDTPLYGIINILILKKSAIELNSNLPYDEKLSSMQKANLCLHVFRDISARAVYDAEFGQYLERTETPEAKAAKIKVAEEYLLKTDDRFRNSNISWWFRNAFYESFPFEDSEGGCSRHLYSCFTAQFRDLSHRIVAIKKLAEILQNSESMKDFILYINGKYSDVALEKTINLLAGFFKWNDAKIDYSEAINKKLLEVLLEDETLSKQFIEYIFKNNRIVYDIKLSRDHLPIKEKRAIKGIYSIPKAVTLIEKIFSLTFGLELRNKALNLFFGSEKLVEAVIDYEMYSRKNPESFSDITEVDVKDWWNSEGQKYDDEWGDWSDGRIAYKTVDIKCSFTTPALPPLFSFLYIDFYSSRLNEIAENIIKQPIYLNRLLYEKAFWKNFPAAIQERIKVLRADNTQKMAEEYCNGAQGVVNAYIVKSLKEKEENKEPAKFIFFTPQADYELLKARVYLKLFQQIAHSVIQKLVLTAAILSNKKSHVLIPNMNIKFDLELVTFILCETNTSLDYKKLMLEIIEPLNQRINKLPINFDIQNSIIECKPELDKMQELLCPQLSPGLDIQ